MSRTTPTERTSKRGRSRRSPTPSTRISRLTSLLQVDFNFSNFCLDGSSAGVETLGTRPNQKLYMTRQVSHSASNEGPAKQFLQGLFYLADFGGGGHRAKGLGRLCNCLLLPSPGVLLDLRHHWARLERGPLHDVDGSGI